MPNSQDPNTPAAPAAPPEAFYHHGPARPLKPETHSDFRTRDYLKGPARKILRDLIKVARQYDGKLVKIFQTGRSGETRCPDCTDKFTGASLYKNCPTCLGSGFTKQYDDVGEYWVRVDFSPKLNVTSELGNYDRQGHRDAFYVLGAPLLRDQDLLIVPDVKEVYKVVDVEGQIVAMQGIIISQVVNCLLVSPGSIEYNLIDW